MKKYLNRSGQSGIAYYQIEETSIIIWFNGSTKSYTYSYRKAGSLHVEAMKRLATDGLGLNAYINSNVKFLYD